MERTIRRRRVKTKEQGITSLAYSLSGEVPQWNYNTSDENWKSITYLIRNGKNCN